MFKGPFTPRMITITIKIVLKYTTSLGWHRNLHYFTYYQNEFDYKVLDVLVLTT